MAAQGEVRAGAPPVARSNRDLRGVRLTFVVAALVGLVAVVVYGLATTDKGAWATVLGGSVLTAGAFAFGGALLGFVFAIPRSRQEQPAQPAPADGPRRLSDYAANTNLEQVSDWLTKILIGITLTQFTEMTIRLDKAAIALGPLVGGGASARAVVLALMAYFSVWGFFFAYLTIRLWMPRALSHAEREEEAQKREIEKEKERRALEERAYEDLYQPPPVGFSRVIESIEAHRDKPGAVMTPHLWLYLASAYGQKHAAEHPGGEAQARDAQLADDTRQKAVAAAREAARLDPTTVRTIKLLYEGKDEQENDLASLKPDPDLDALVRQ
jgi:hypothetical protein